MLYTGKKKSVKIDDESTEKGSDKDEKDGEVNDWYIFFLEILQKLYIYSWPIKIIIDMWSYLRVYVRETIHSLWKLQFAKENFWDGLRSIILWKGKILSIVWEKERMRDFV